MHSLENSVKTVLVTGGAGFIGSHVVESLILAGKEVIVLDNFSVGRLENLKGLPLEIVECSILNKSQVDKAVKRADAVIHLAAMVSVPGSIKEPAKCAEINVIGTINLLAACQKHGIRRFVQASSSAVYGTEPGQPKQESSHTAPSTPYAASKLSAEHFAASAASLGLSCSSLRFFNVYGPRQDPSSPYSGVVSIFLSRVKEGQPITIFGDGGQTRDFIFVKDVASHVVQCLDRTPDFHEVLNVASGESMTVYELAKEVQKAMGREVEIRFAAPRLGDIYNSSACVRNLRAADSHRPVPFSQGLLETVASLAF